MKWEFLFPCKEFKIHWNLNPRFHLKVTVGASTVEPEKWEHLFRRWSLAPGCRGDRPQIVCKQLCRGWRLPQIQSHSIFFRSSCWPLTLPAGGLTGLGGPCSVHSSYRKPTREDTLFNYPNMFTCSTESPDRTEGHNRLSIMVVH